jgi:hypothetical protein
LRGYNVVGITDEGFMMYATEMGSDGMIFLPSHEDWYRRKQYYGFASTILMVVMLVLLMKRNYEARR